MKSNDRQKNTITGEIALGLLKYGIGFLSDNVGFCMQLTDNVKVNFVSFKFHVVLPIIKTNIFVVIL